MNNQYIYGKFFDDLVKLPKEEIVELMKLEHKFDTENNKAQTVLNELIYSGVTFDDMLDHLEENLPTKSKRQKKLKAVLTVFISTMMDEDLYFTHNRNFINNPHNYEKLNS